MIKYDVNLNNFFDCTTNIQLPLIMKTPMKRKQWLHAALEPTNVIQSKYKSSLKKSIKHKKEQQQFNPSLYITSTITIQDVLQIKQAFDHYDQNHNGYLNPNDLKLALFQQNFHANRQTVFSILAEYDQQGLGVLTFPAFIGIITSDPTSLQTLDDLKKIFKKYDRGNKGFINQSDLGHIIKTLNENVSQEQLKEMFTILDRNNTGQIKYQDFIMIMHHPSCFQ